MTIVENFVQNIHTLVKSPNEKKFLLAISGGVDSMVLADFFLKGDLLHGVAHVNHKLRQCASDEDANFVRSYADEKGLEYFEFSMDWTNILKGNKQENARVARYNFFQKVLNENGYDYIVTAHHIDDRIENMLMNMMRGSGLTGLTGMRDTHTNIIRPLTKFSKEILLQYANANGVTFRHDASNDSDVYMRNKVRHNLVPMIHSLEDRAKFGLEKTLHHLEAEKILVQEYIAWLYVNCVKSNANIVEIDHLCLGKNADTKLFYILKDLGFNFEQCIDILSKTTSSGAVIRSNTHEVLKSELKLFLRKISNGHLENLSLDILGEGQFTFGSKTIIVRQGYYTEEMGVNTLLLGAREIHFPLTVRYKKDGDTFRPRSLKGKSKTLKAYLTDRKQNRWQKESTIVVEDSLGQILGVFGFEASFEYTENSSETRLAITIIDE